MLKDDCHGCGVGVGGLSVWLNGKAPCVNAITFWCFHSFTHCLLSLLSCPSCSWDEHESRVSAQEDLE